MGSCQKRADKKKKINFHRDAMQKYPCQAESSLVIRRKLNMKKIKIEKKETHAST